jgi:hypothetical protein
MEVRTQFERDDSQIALAVQRAVVFPIAGAGEEARGAFAAQVAEHERFEVLGQEQLAGYFSVSGSEQPAYDDELLARKIGAAETILADAVILCKIKGGTARAKMLDARTGLTLWEASSTAHCSEKYFDKERRTAAMLKAIARTLEEGTESPQEESHRRLTSQPVREGISKTLDKVIPTKTQVASFAVLAGLVVLIVVVAG